jgi:mitochondrial import receptor subunit TOM22
MVKVQEVPDDSSPYGSSDSEASGSSESLASAITDIDINNESIVDRIVALVDIVPPQTRHNISTRVSSVVSTVQKTGKVVGNIVWVLTTTALLVGLPLALVLEDEAKLAQQEKELTAQQQGQQSVRLLFLLFMDMSKIAKAKNADAKPVWWSTDTRPAKEGFAGSSRFLDMPFDLIFMVNFHTLYFLMINTCSPIILVTT